MGKKITKKSSDLEGDEVTLFTLKVYIYIERDNVFGKKSLFFGGVLTTILIEWLFIRMGFEGLPKCLS